MSIPQLMKCIILFGYVVEGSTAKAGHIMHGNIGERIREHDAYYGAKALSTVQRGCSNCFDLKLSNITSVQLKVIEVLGASERGVHALTETKADIMTMNSVNSEVQGYATARLTNGIGRFVWGEAVKEKSAGIAMVESPEANSTVTKMELKDE